MNTIQTQMPVLEGCSIEACAYNSDLQCHARAITIGNGRGPFCDTACLDAEQQFAGTPGPAGVGACKSSQCVHNESLQCTSNAVAVGRRREAIGCLSCAAA